MKKNNLISTFLLAIIFLFGGMTSNALAQGSLMGMEDHDSYYSNSSRGGLMRNGDINIDTEDGFTLGGAQDENPTPLGSGIAILLAAGAGYTLMKRKEEQK